MRESFYENNKFQNSTPYDILSSSISGYEGCEPPNIFPGSARDNKNNTISIKIREYNTNKNNEKD